MGVKGLLNTSTGSSKNKQRDKFKTDDDEAWYLYLAPRCILPLCPIERPIVDSFGTT